MAAPVRGRRRMAATSWVILCVTVAALCVGAAGRPAGGPADLARCNVTALALESVQAMHAELFDDHHAYTRACKSCPPQQDVIPALTASAAYMHLPTEAYLTASRELLSLLMGQWDNGLLPNIVYVNGTGVPPPSFWKPKGKSPYPKGMPTSGLASLPLHATVALRNFYLHYESTATQQLILMFPHLYKYHQYLFSSRKVDATVALVYVSHPWETGMDALQTYLDLVPPCSSTEGLPRAPASYRERAIYPGDDAYNRTLCLAQCAQQVRYDDKTIRDRCGFVVESVFFNSVLYQATRDLATIARFIGKSSTVIANIELWADSLQNAMLVHLYNNETGTLMDRSWNAATGKYAFVDSDLSSTLLSGLLLRQQSYSAATQSPQPPLPSVPGVDNWPAGSLYTYMSAAFFPSPLVPTLSRNSKSFSPNQCMSGPVWLRNNFVLFSALQQAGFSGVASDLEHSTTKMMCSAAHGSAATLPEAFDASTASPLPGSDSVVGTAALSLFVLPAGTRFQPQVVPLTYTALIVFICIELVFVFGVGTSCVLFSILAIRRLRSETAKGLPTQAGTGSYRPLSADEDSSGVAMTNDSKFRGGEEAASFGDGGGYDSELSADNDGLPGGRWRQGGGGRLHSGSSDANGVGVVLGTSPVDDDGVARRAGEAKATNNGGGKTEEPKQGAAHTPVVEHAIHGVGNGTGARHRGSGGGSGPAPHQHALHHATPNAPIPIRHPGRSRNYDSFNDGGMSYHSGVSSSVRSARSADETASASQSGGMLAWFWG